MPGLPKLITGETVFDMGKEDFARHMKALVEAGASIIAAAAGAHRIISAFWHRQYGG